MKYLKPFNEAKSGTDIIDELTTLCHYYLPSLFDDGYRIVVKDCRSRFSNSTTCAAFSINIKTPDENILWEDIKDYIIPFMTVLEDDYTYYKMTNTLKDKYQIQKNNQDYIFIRYAQVSGYKSTAAYLNKEDLMNDKINDDAYISRIILHVNPKKK